MGSEPDSALQVGFWSMEFYEKGETIGLFSPDFTRKAQIAPHSCRETRV
jgi:hypothetical protein